VAGFLIAYLGVLITIVAGGRLSAKLRFKRLHREQFSGTEFLLQGRKSCTWFEHQHIGAIRRWSKYRQVVEFDGGMWQLLRYGPRASLYDGLIISRDSLPGSCTWDELRAYLKQQIENAEAEAR
jgi:hypothetical protein